MINVVSFSGGRTSAYMAYLMRQKMVYLGWDCVFVYCDTGAEHPETYKFIKKVVDWLGIELICLKASVNRDFGKSNSYTVVSVGSLGFDLSVMKSNAMKYGGFTVNRPYCTDKLKTIISKKYCDEKFGSGNYVNWLGIRADEPRRIRTPSKQFDLVDGKKPKPFNIRYLAEISEYNKSDVILFWKKMHFDLMIDEHLGNCVFCIKKSLPKIALAARQEPDLWDQWCQAFGKDSSVRKMKADKFGVGHIYRKWASPEQVIGMFSDLSTDELEQHIYKSRRLDVGGCGESCEAYSDQLELNINE